MSVKMMTTDQIHTNLATIHNMWPGGIPTEQYDQVNALKAELKRRGVDAKVQVPGQPAIETLAVLSELSLEQLTKELSKTGEALGKNPQDDALQERFANIRFEIRQKVSKGDVQQLTRTPDSHPPVTGNFDPRTGETFQSQLANNNNGNGHSFENGAVSRHTTEMPPRPDLAAQMAQVQRMQDMEQLVRKHNLAKIAAESAAQILTKYSDPNGDDIENACTIGLQIAENIFGKVGL